MTSYLEGNDRLSRHFTVSELTHSKTAIKQSIPNLVTANSSVHEGLKLVANMLEAVREFGGGFPIKPSSAYRSKALNSVIGGVSSSKHVKGLACDIELPHVSNLTLARWISLQPGLGIKKVILEFHNRGVPSSGWVHVEFDQDLAHSKSPHDAAELIRAYRKAGRKKVHYGHLPTDWLASADEDISQQLSKA